MRKYRLMAKNYRKLQVNWLKGKLAEQGRGSRSKLAEFLSVTPDVISRMTNDADPGKETRAISGDELAKMAEFFRDQPPMPDPLRRVPIGQEFSTGDGHAGTVFKDGFDSSRANIPDGEIPQVDTRMGLGSTTEAETVQIPAGDGSIAAVPIVDTWKIPHNVLRRRLKGAVTSLHIVECEGDSMEPRIHDGDFVFIDTSRQAPSPDGIFAINDGIGQSLKRLELVPNTDPQRIKIIPENPRHTTYERTVDEVHIIGRYLCRLTMS